MKPKLKILIVEDSFPSRIVLVDILKKYGFCHVAVDGLEAVEAVRLAIANGKHYDLICMDIVMPNLGGIEALHRIRHIETQMSDQITAKAKIFFTTALDDIKNVTIVYNGTADGYFTKPIQKKWIVRELQTKGLISGQDNENYDS